MGFLSPNIPPPPQFRRTRLLSLLRLLWLLLLLGWRILLARGRSLISKADASTLGHLARRIIVVAIAFLFVPDTKGAFASSSFRRRLAGLDLVPIGTCGDTTRLRLGRDTLCAVVLRVFFLGLLLERLSASAFGCRFLPAAGTHLVLA